MLITAAHLATEIPFGLGYVHGPDDPSAGSAVALFGATRGTGVPREVLRLQDSVRRVTNQGPTNSCVGQAIGSAIDIRCRVLKLDKGDPSRMAIYTLARELGRTSSKSSPLVDDGSNAQCALLGVRDVGVPSETDCPFDPERVNQDLSWDEARSGSWFLVSAWWNIHQQGKARIDVACQALDKNYPVVFAMGVDMAFVNYAGGTIDSIDLSAIIGGHMLAILGYRTRADGAREFLVLNSWGEGWGEHGCCWIHENVLAMPNAAAFSVMEVLP